MLNIVVACGCMWLHALLYTCSFQYGLRWLACCSDRGCVLQLIVIVAGSLSRVGEVSDVVAAGFIREAGIRRLTR